MIGALIFGLLHAAGPFSAPAADLEITSDGVEPAVIDELRAACLDLARRHGAPPGRWRIRVAQAETVDQFAARTGRARFEAAALVGPVLWIQPRAILGRFGELRSIWSHECAHAWLRAQEVPPLPSALEEVAAIGLAGSIGRLAPASPPNAEGLVAIDRELAAPKSRESAERALARAAAALWPILERWIRDRVLLERLRGLQQRERWSAEDWAALDPH